MTPGSDRPVLLVLRALKLGDLLVAVPGLRGLRSGFPDHEMVLAAPQWLSPIIPLIGGLWPVLMVVDGLWPLWDEKRQTLHDKIASTQVVMGKQPRTPR